MATAEAPASRPAASPHDTYVETQLKRAVGRIRNFDLLAAGCGLFIGIIAYTISVVLLDAWLELDAWALYLAFAGFVVGIGAYLGFAAALPLWRGLNPYYAAVRVEQHLPAAKNSIVNWLDLRTRTLPPAIHQAVAARAARDLSEADLEEAISGKHVLKRGVAVLGLLATLLVVLAILGPGPFFSHVVRAFAPFLESAVAPRTTIQVLAPEGGHARVPINQPVSIVLRVDGREPSPEAPDALKFLFRRGPEEPYQERAFVRGDNPREWTYRLPAIDVQTGFLYKAIGGGAETPEFQVQAIASPAITRFDVTYKHRPYLRLKEEKNVDPNLVGWRGTEVTLIARTNRQVRDGRLTIDGVADPLRYEAIPGEPMALRFRFILEKAGTYRIRFTSTEGEPSGDSVPYTITIRPDHPPVVELTAPSTETIDLPANATLQVKGKVKDDHGITDVRLLLRHKDGLSLPAKEYPHARYRYTDQGYPKDHDYMDVIELNTLKVKDGDVLEYQLEATDNCDYPQGQVGRSKVQRIRIIKPQSPKDQEEQRQKAQTEQKQHDQQTGEKRQQEDQARQKEAKPDQSSQGQPQPNDPKSAEQAKHDKKLEQDKQKLENQAREQQPGRSREEPKPEKKGEASPQPKNDPNQGGQKQPNPQGQPDQKQDRAGEKRPEPKPQPGDKDPNNPGQAGESKGSKGGDKQPGEARGGPPKAGGDPDKGDGTGKTPPNTQPKGSDPSKGGEKSTDKPGTGQGTNDTKQGTAETGQPKPGGPPTGAEKPSTKGPENGQGTLSKDQKTPAGEARGDTPVRGDARGPEDLQPPKAGDPPPSQTAGSSSSSQKGAKGAGESRTAPKSGGKDAGGAHEPKTDPRPTQAGQPGPRKDNATQRDVDELAKQLQNPNPQAKRDAEKQLVQIAQEAKDPKVRESAEQTLKKNAPQGAPDKTGQDPVSKAGGPAPKGTDTTDTKPPPGAGQQPKGTDAKQPGATDGPGTPTPKAGDPKEKGTGTNSDGSKQGESDPTSNPGKGGATGTPGAGKGGTERPSDTPGAGGDGPDGTPADPAHKRKAAELQLEELMKKVTPDMLKEMNWSDEDLQKWYKGMRELIERNYERDLEKFAPPQRGGPSTIPGGFRRGSAPTGPGTDPNNLGRTVPPPEFRNAYQEFNQEVNKSKKPTP